LFDPESLMKEPIHEISSQELEQDGMLPDLESVRIAMIAMEADQEEAELASSTALGSYEQPYFDKAWAFVQAVRLMHVDLGMEFKMLWNDDTSFNGMFHIVEQLLLAQDQMRSLGKNATIDIGYHYTAEANLPKIREQGLLTKAERDGRGIFSKYNGSCYGDGVYSGNNPFAYRNRRLGHICLLIARLRGNEAQFLGRGQTWNLDYDTRLVSNGFHQMVVLRTSRQCIPLLGFDESLVDICDGQDGSTPVFDLHVRLQGLLDHFFNGGFRMNVPQVIPPVRRDGEISRRSQSGRLSGVGAAGQATSASANMPGFTGLHNGAMTAAAATTNASSSSAAATSNMDVAAATTNTKD